jgi:hypothetical protein
MIEQSLDELLEAYYVMVRDSSYTHEKDPAYPKMIVRVFRDGTRVYGQIIDGRFYFGNTYSEGMFELEYE